jgi:peptidoglycan/xylan/chitin deacetylase (PgdA/CDA1 family)
MAIEPGVATVCLTFDCEMSAHYPRRQDLEWNYRKGDLDDDTKAYALEAGRRVAAAGGRMHFFVLGATFEQPSVAWLKELRDLGHAIGNHTYNHVNVKAADVGEAQFRFRRASWLANGRTVEQLIDDDIRLCTLAMRERLGIAPNGFRTPGGFANGLEDRPDLQAMLLSHGYTWVSSLYPRHPVRPDTWAPQPGELDAVVARQMQPFVYPSGLVEVPMSPPSDVTTMRTGRWSLEHFKHAAGAALDACLEHGTVWDFLSHPSALGVVDPGFEVIDMILGRVRDAGPAARMATLDAVAAGVTVDAR